MMSRARSFAMYSSSHSTSARLAYTTSSSIPIRDRLLSAGCTIKDADGWEKELQQWEEHSVWIVFVLYVWL